MWLFLRNLIYNTLVLAFLLGWVPWHFLVPRAQSPDAWAWQHYAALPFAVVGGVIYLACVWMFIRKGRGTPLPFDPAKKLITRGPYAWVRNPIYIAVLLIIFSEALFIGQIVVWLYFVFCTCVFQLIVRLAEENELRRRFGALYSDYCNVCPRWFPRRPRPRTQTIAPFGTSDRDR